MLLVQLQYAPEAGEPHHAKDDGHILVADEQRARQGGNARQQEGWPALLAKVVFALDDQGMEHPDTEERGKADD